LLLRVAMLLERLKMRFTELIKEAVDNVKSKVVSGEAVLDYVRHTDHDFNIGKHTILNHATWALRQVPISSLNIPDIGDEEKVDPYNRVIDLDYDHVSDITAQDIQNKPIVIDNQGFIIDGNHRAMAAQMQGMSTVPAYAPVEAIDEAGLYYKGYPCTQDCSGHMAGYAWAERKGINDEDYCGGTSNSFWEGCKSKTEGR